MGGLTTPVVDCHSLGVRVLPLVTELPEGHEHVEQVAALLGEPILVAGRMILIGDGLQYVVVDQLVQPVGEHVAGDLEVGLEVVEPAYAEEGISQDEKGPAVTDYVDRLGDDAVEVIERLSGRHDPSLPQSVALYN